MTESLGVTTVSTTKAQGRIGINANVLGEILSSNGLLRSNVGDLSMMKIQEIVINIACSLWVEYTECKKFRDVFGY